MEIKKQCIELLGEGDIKACLQKLNDTIAEGDTRNYLSPLRGKYNRLLKERGLGILSNEEFWREENKIDSAIRDLLSRLKPEDTFEKVFAETFLIICNESKLKEMKIVFGNKYFANAEFLIYGQPIPEGVFDVIFLEDENNLITQYEKDDACKPTKIPTEANKNRQKEMKNYLDQTSGFFIYLGSFFPLFEYKDRVYFSNSRFSIYARLKELLDYLKYYGK